MKSGMLAAEAVAEALAGDRPAELDRLSGKAARKLGVGGTVRRCATSGPAFAKFGMWGGLVYSALDTYLLRGKAPVDVAPSARRQRDAAAKPTPRRASPIRSPDGVLTFDRLSSVFISNTNHEENQPPHLHLLDPAKAIAVNWERYRSPEARYCPAGVYEIVGAEEGEPRLQINAQNCVHCKTCDIKDPTQNIDWVTPEGGGGPNYPGGM